MTNPRTASWARLSLICLVLTGAVIPAEELAHDGSHPSIAGHRKQAALEWGILGFGP